MRQFLENTKKDLEESYSILISLKSIFSGVLKVMYICSLVCFALNQKTLKSQN